MPKRIDDRDMLVRTLMLIGDGPCCDFFACPGPDHRPVPMASCGKSTAAYELREYLRRHGGWCPEHGQQLDQCHPPEERNDPTAGFWVKQCRPHSICRCQPVVRKVA